MSGGGNLDRGKSAKQGKPSRSERLAQQLRANLKKRKALVRARGQIEANGGRDPATVAGERDDA